MEQLATVKSKYLSELSNIYDNEEITAIFRWICKEIIHKPKLLTEIITVAENNLFTDYLHELKSGKPLQHILGKSGFFNLDFYVNQDVLIPRPETEELVYHIVKKHKNLKNNILDVCTGSGCIAVALKKNLKEAILSGIDISDKALEIAVKNADLNATEVNFIHDDALNLISEKYPLYDVIVSNPPYIKEEEKQFMHRNVLDYEPHLALFVSNEEPLIFYDKISDFAITNLKPGGFLYFEINQYLPKETKDLLDKKGFKTNLIKDLNNNFRFVEAQFLG